MIINEEILIFWIIVGVTAVILFILIGFNIHYCCTRNHTKLTDNDPRISPYETKLYSMSNILINCIFICMISVLSMNIIRRFIPFEICNHLNAFGHILTYLFKSKLYILYILKIEIVYGNTSFKIPKFNIVFYILIAILFFILSSVFTMIDMYIYNQTFYDNVSFSCATEYSLSTLIIFAGFETIFPVYSLYLFIKPLKYIYSKTRDESLLRTGIKHALISSTIILSSFIFLFILIGIFKLYVFGVWDFAFNGYFILCYNTEYTNYYHKCCGFCHKGIFTIIQNNSSPKLTVKCHSNTISAITHSPPNSPPNSPANSPANAPTNALPTSPYSP